MVTPWRDSLCYHLADTMQPRIAPNLQESPDLAESKVAKLQDIKAYIGLPLVDGCGELFGSLCAFDTTTRTALNADDIEAIETLARLLSALLRAEIALSAAVRESERSAMEAQTDALTGLFNRRAWDEFLAKEEARCRRYGHPAAVVSVDLNGLKARNDSLGHTAGDALIKAAAAALKESARSVDVVARVGGDEFYMLAVQCDAAGVIALQERLDFNLKAAGISASVGIARRGPESGLVAALQSADQRMYESKRAHHSQQRKVV